MAEPLDRAAIEANLAALGDRLTADHVEARLLIVGGSYLALHGLRDSTADVDTVTRLDAAVKSAIQAVAAARGLDPSWLNDRAAAFAPSTPVGDPEVLFEARHARRARTIARLRVPLEDRPREAA